jgi:hypothetical protein
MIRSTLNPRRACRIHHAFSVHSLIGRQKIRTARAVPTTVAMQEDHDFPHRLLLGPGAKNACGANRPDPVDSRVAGLPWSR